MEAFPQPRGTRSLFLSLLELSLLRAVIFPSPFLFFLLPRLPLYHRLCGFFLFGSLLFLVSSQGTITAISPLSKAPFVLLKLDQLKERWESFQREGKVINTHTHRHTYTPSRASQISDTWSWLTNHKGMRSEPAADESVPNDPGQTL